MTLEKEFAQAVTGHLDGPRARVEAALSHVVRSLPDDTRYLVVEYDSPSFSTGFAVFTFPVLAGGAPGPVRRLLDDGAVVVPPLVHDASRFEEIEPWDLASELLEAWLVERWAAVPGRRPTAFVAHHDSHFETNLADASTVTADTLESLHRAAPG